MYLGALLSLVACFALSNAWTVRYYADRLLLDHWSIAAYLHHHDIDVHVPREYTLLNTVVLEGVQNLTSPMIDVNLNLLCSFVADNEESRGRGETYGIRPTDEILWRDFQMNYTIWSIRSESACPSKHDDLVPRGYAIRQSEQLLQDTFRGCSKDPIAVVLDFDQLLKVQHAGCVQLVILASVMGIGKKEKSGFEIGDLFKGSYDWALLSVLLGETVTGFIAGLMKKSMSIEHIASYDDENMFTHPPSFNFSLYEVYNIRSPCPPHLRTCPNSDICYDLAQTCNMINDCPGGEDEAACGNTCDFNNGTCYWTMDGFKVANESMLLSTDNRTRPGNFVMVRIADDPQRPLASITSSWFGKPNGRDCEVRFDFLRYKDRIGDLKVMFLLIGGEHQTRLRISKNTVVRWQTAKTIIGDIQSPFRIRFEFESNMAIDDGVCALDNIKMVKCDVDTYPPNECPLHEFKCHNGECIQRGKVCNMESDCATSEDEERCEDLLPKEAYVNFDDGPRGWNVTVGRASVSNETFYAPGRLDEPGNFFLLEPLPNRPSTDYHYSPERPVAPRIQAQASVISPVFPAPPKQVQDRDSPFYNSCQVRMRAFVIVAFAFADIRLEFVSYDERTGIWNEIHSSASSTKGLTCSHSKITRGSSKAWIDFRCPLARMIKCPYRVAIRAMAFMSPDRPHDVKIAIDDLSMSLECFGKGSMTGIMIQSGCTERLLAVNSRYRNATTKAYDPPVDRKWVFMSCGARGRYGPTQKQCDSFYSATPDLKVNVLAHDEPFAGAQIWTVLETREYTLTAMGAAGGTGAKNVGFGSEVFEPNAGSFATGVFKLKQGDKIYMIVGQRGEDACAKVSETSVHGDLPLKICSRGSSITDDLLQKKRNDFAGGGGGGGGGSFIFKLEDDDKIVPLVVAGGGGGLAYKPAVNSDRTYNESAENGMVEGECYLVRSLHIHGYSAKTDPDSAGGGGGWNGSQPYQNGGEAFLDGALGGKACQKAVDRNHWDTAGGFGGGGGACTAGGGGGGYAGGRVDGEDTWDLDGMFGASFVHPDANKAEIECGTNRMGGEIVVAPHCPCEDICLGFKEGVPQCGCLREGFVAKGLICAPSAKEVVIRPPVDYQRAFSEGGMSAVVIVSLVMGCLLTLCCVLLIVLSVVHRRQLRRKLSRRTEAISQSSQLERLRQGNIVLEMNPHYEFCGTKCSTADLVHVARENLSLVSALGHGAFGEVYKGQLCTYKDNKPYSMAVAVKTLPALSTEQNEQDFVMEALIMSKFDHPNIVTFYGVCFEDHPRFIVLELLAGGDLKSFLRTSRADGEYSVCLSMIDLVRMAVDVAGGCQYLEQNHFIHRDIAARNCLLTCHTPTEACPRTVKIADFGMARDVYRADYYHKGGQAMVPVKWMPPEAFLDGIFTSKTDVWSFGILLWEVFSLGYMPYPGRGNMQVMKFVSAGGRLDAPACCPAPLYRIMLRCWSDDHQNRPSFAEISEMLFACLEEPDVLTARLPSLSHSSLVEEVDDSLQHSGTATPLDESTPTTPLQQEATPDSPISDVCHNEVFMDSDLGDSTEQLLFSSERENHPSGNSDSGLCDPDFAVVTA